MGTLGTLWVGRGRVGLGLGGGSEGGSFGKLWVGTL